MYNVLAGADKSIVQITVPLGQVYISKGLDKENMVIIIDLTSVLPQLSIISFVNHTMAYVIKHTCLVQYKYRTVSIVISATARDIWQKLLLFQGIYIVHMCSDRLLPGQVQHCQSMLTVLGIYIYFFWFDFT